MPVSETVVREKPPVGTETREGQPVEGSGKSGPGAAIAIASPILPNLGSPMGKNENGSAGMPSPGAKAVLLPLLLDGASLTHGFRYSNGCKTTQGAAGMKFAIEEAQLRLVELIERAHQGEQILISGLDGALVEIRPVRVTAIGAKKVTDVLGVLREEIQYEDGWDAPMTDAEVVRFLGLK